MRTGEFLDGIVAHLQQHLPAELATFQLQRRANMIKLWYQEPRLHYEVWPVTGRDLIEVGLHFEAEAETNQRLLHWFDPHIVELMAALDGAVELEQWTASWGHLFHVFHAPALGLAEQRAVATWLTRLIPVSEPLLAQALATLGPLPSGERAGRDWAAWRRERARRRTTGGSSSGGGRRQPV